MRKVVKMVVMGLLFVVILTLGISGAVFANNYVDPDNAGVGRAPSAGDGISDGPGWEIEDITIPNGPNG